MLRIRDAALSRMQKDWQQSLNYDSPNHDERLQADSGAGASTPGQCIRQFWKSPPAAEHESQESNPGPSGDVDPSGSMSHKEPEKPVEPEKVPEIVSPCTLSPSWNERTPRGTSQQLKSRQCSPSQRWRKPQKFHQNQF